MSRTGSLVICVQNLDFSGANQVILNTVAGTMHGGNVLVVSPRPGPIASKFVENGASIRIGIVDDVLTKISDVFLLMCNTIMTADIVCKYSNRSHPVIWILHEWWTDEMIDENLKMRNIKTLSLKVVKEALKKANHVVCVCEAQRQLYNLQANSSAIFVGVPRPAQLPYDSVKLPPIPPPSLSSDGNMKPIVFLTLGIICPRKNQIFAVQQFKKFAGDRTDVRHILVGARYTRDYEREYVEKLKREVGDDPRIEVHDVTPDVDPFYDQADVLLFPSLNEVTPMVISEAMSHFIPVITTNIAGIPEMVSDGVEGFLFSPGDEVKCQAAMTALAEDSELRYKMGCAGRYRFDSTFDLDIMVESYRRLIFDVAPPVVLVDMDGVIVDWDLGFTQAWGNRSPIHREKSFFMEDCVGIENRLEAQMLMHSQSFFLNLPPMKGAISALNEMVDAGLKVLIVTDPIVISSFCLQEKIQWIRSYLGQEWVGRLIVTSDKTSVKADLLIDDLPFDLYAPGGKHTMASWKRILFDQPYNRKSGHTSRLNDWSEWKDLVLNILGKPELEEDDDFFNQSRDDRSASNAALIDALPAVLSDQLVDTKEPTNAQLIKQSLKSEAKAFQDTIDNAQVKLALSSDPDELHLFRKSYQTWKATQEAKRESSRSPPKQR